MNTTLMISKFIKKLWFVLAILLVVSAVLISSVRMALPYLNDFKDDISFWIAEAFELPIEFGHIHAGWQGSGPSVILKQITFVDQQTDNPLQLSIASISIEIDFWNSLISRDLVANDFTLRGVKAELDVGQLKDRRSASSEQTNLLDVLQPLFLTHLRRFEVIDSELVLHNRLLNKDDRTLDIDQLSWLNKEGKHQGLGEFSFRDIDSRGLKFIIDVDDDSDGLSGLFYVKSKGLNSAEFLEDFTADHISDLKSYVPLELWFTLSASQFTKLEAIIKPGFFQWRENGVEQQIDFKRGKLIAEFNSDSSLWQLSDLVIQDHELQTSKIQLSAAYQSGQGWLLETTDLNLKPFAQLSRLFTLPPDVAKLIATLNPALSIESLSARYQNAENWHVYGQVDHVGWQPVGDIPAISDWQMDFAVNPNNAVTQWRTQNSTLHFPELYDKPFSIESGQFDLIAQWNRGWQGASTQPWDIVVQNVFMQLPNNHLIAEAKIFPDDEGDVALRLFAEASRTEAEHVEPFLPRFAMGQEVYDYVVGAIKGGHVTSGQAMWQGSFADFPYTNNQGVFQADLNLADGVFKFQPDWPAADQLKLKLSFINEGLYFESHEANLLNAELIKLTAEIPNLVSDSAYLQLNASIAATGSATHAVMKNSMLADSVGAALDVLNVKGDVSATLDLFVPLVSSEDEISVKGDVYFNNNPVFIAGPEFNLTDVSGVLSYDMEKLTANALSFTWGHAPFSANLKTEQRDDGYHIDLDFSHQWQPDVLLQEYKMPYLSGLTAGDINWQGQLAIHLPESGFEYEFSADFDLTETELALPAPYYKKLGQAERLNLTLIGNEQTTQINAHMGNELRFNAVMPHEQGQFSRAYLVLGEEQLGVPGQGFNIAVHLPDAILDDYIAFVMGMLDDFSNTPSTGGTPIITKPKRIRGDLAQLTLGPLTWHDVVFDMQSADTQWFTKVNAQEFRGKINLSENWFDDGLQVDADYFNIQFTESPQNEDESEAEIAKRETDIAKRIFENLPAIKASCLKCEWDGQSLGKIEADISRKEDKILVNNLSLRKGKNHRVSSTGFWQWNDNVNTTNLIGKLNSKDIGAWVREYDFQSPTRDSSASVYFDLDWQGAPYNLNTKTLNGQLKWTLGEGYFTEVSDKGARLFSLLSMDSLVRKLRLDFRDVFSKGLFFNEMSGSMSINKGIASTNDTHMNGVAGNMDIWGVSDLNTQVIDYNISFAPKVTSSIPLLVAWMVNPVTGVAALAIDQVLEKAQVISNIEFKVDGTFSEPVINEVSRSSREVQIGNDNKRQPQDPPKSPPANLIQPKSGIMPSIHTPAGST